MFIIYTKTAERGAERGTFRASGKFCGVVQSGGHNSTESVQFVGMDDRIWQKSRLLQVQNGKNAKFFAIYMHIVKKPGQYWDDFSEKKACRRRNLRL